MEPAAQRSFAIVQNDKTTDESDSWVSHPGCIATSLKIAATAYFRYCDNECRESDNQRFLIACPIVNPRSPLSPTTIRLATLSHGTFTTAISSCMRLVES